MCWLPASSGYPPGLSKEALGGGQEPLPGVQSHHSQCPCHK